MELRTIGQEIRADTGENGLTFSGYVATFDTLCERLKWFKEKIQAGAFAETIANDDIRALMNHDANYVLGRNKASTLTLREDHVGLWFEVQAPDVEWARALSVSVARGDVNECSFAFECIKDSWEYLEDGKEVRTLVQVRLQDISIVTYPAYPKTGATVRSELEVYAERRESLIIPPRLELAKKRLALKEKEF